MQNTDRTSPTMTRPQTAGMAAAMTSSYTVDERVDDSCRHTGCTSSLVRLAARIRVWFSIAIGGSSER
jgi:hypothetical protein